MLYIYLCSRLPKSKNSYSPYRFLNHKEREVTYMGYSYFFNDHDGRLLFQDNNYNKVNRMYLFQAPPNSVLQ